MNEQERMMLRVAPCFIQDNLPQRVHFAGLPGNARNFDMGVTPFLLQCGQMISILISLTFELTGVRSVSVARPVE